MSDAPPAAAPARNRLLRASNSKVRSGCISCKQRRVKCDERKPECLRCENYGCRCEGYEFPITISGRVVPKHRLLPKISHAEPLTYGPAAGFNLWQAGFDAAGNRDYVAQLPVEGRTFWSQPTLNYAPQHTAFYNASVSDQLMTYSPSISILETGQEEQYFRYYKEVTLRQLSGIFDNQTWSSLFLQASHEEPFVLRAIIAIGALSKAWEVSQLKEPSVQGKCVKTLPDINDSIIKNPHHKFALQQYGKSIKRMREVFSKDKENVRIALLSCLLTICFESLHGRHETAIMQVQSGLQIMQEWVKRQPKVERTAGLYSPAPSVIEDGLFSAFERLDITAMPFFDKRSESFHRTKSLEGAHTIKCMPKFFTDIREAGNYLSVISVRIVHFVKFTEINLSGSRYKKQTMHLDKDMETVYRNRRDPPTRAILDDIETYTQEILRWQAAFQPMMEQAHSPGYENALVPAMFLSLYASHETVLCRGLRCVQECDFDELLPEFIKIVTLVENIIAHPSFSHLVGRPVFSFEVNFVLPLLVVGLKCRDWQLRHRAIDLLRNYPRREGTWDSSVAAGITLWMMALEEEGLEYGTYIPEQSRARLGKVKQDFTKRTAYLNATQTKLDGSVVFRETVIDW